YGGVKEAAADMFRLANDARIRHAIEDLCHLACYRVECAADYAQRHAVNGGAGVIRFHLGALRWSEGRHVQVSCPTIPGGTTMTRLPKRSTVAPQPGGSTVVASI